MMSSQIYVDSQNKLEAQVMDLADRLAVSSIPFWSPRYNAHMAMETTLASMIGYMTAMMYSPNNVANETSPVTTELEYLVGKQLCNMLGYPKWKQDSINPWGHLACDGSVANLEAIWVARNLKYYPLSLRLAVSPKDGDTYDGPLGFIAHSFEVNRCGSKKKTRLVDCSTWDLLNLEPATALGLPDQLFSQYGVSSDFLTTALKPFLVQSMGMEALNARFNIKVPLDERTKADKAAGQALAGKFLIAATKHYSWPKGGAIAGLGSDTFLDIKVDVRARMSMKDLEAKLRH
jgi:hypothetical protein